MGAQGSVTSTIEKKFSRAQWGKVWFSRGLGFRVSSLAFRA